MWTVDVCADVGCDFASQCTVIFLTSISSASTHCSICRPHTQDAVAGMSYFSAAWSCILDCIAVYKMQRIATDVARSVVCLSVCVSVCLLVTRMCPGKTTEPMEMPFGGLSWVGSRNHVPDGCRDPPWEGQFWGLCLLKSFGGCICLQQRDHSVINKVFVLTVLVCTFYSALYSVLTLNVSCMFSHTELCILLEL